MNTDPATLDRVFGPGRGTTVEARARSSRRLFARGLDQLVEASGPTNGRVLTAREAFDAYGFEKLLEVAEEGSALLASSADAAGLPLSTRRKQLGLDERTVAARAHVTVEEVRACEASRRLPLRTYENIGRVLGLDERFVAVKRHPTPDGQIATRLRSLGDDAGVLGQAAVATLAEVAWVAATQGRVADQLGFCLERHGLTPSGNFGTSGYPAYKWGYRFAQETRKALAIQADEPILSMRGLIEDVFGIILIQCDLGDQIAGATIEIGDYRAIVVNLSGANRSAYVRRTTMAHELGHLLFDPAPDLSMLKVDEYGALDRAREEISDPVEQRANAFAVELLAPQDAILAHFEKNRDLTETVGHFGLGPTPSKHQIRNASNGRVSAAGMRVARSDSDEWRKYSAFEGAESLAIIDFHPVSGIRPSRAGRFGGLVIRAAQEEAISWDTAAAWLETSEAEARNAAAGIRELFPTVWK